MSLDIGLIVTSVIFAILVLIGAVYFIVYFQHPQDRNQAWFPKIVVVKRNQKLLRLIFR
jgi:LMBR1 domain-containing protein 1